MLPVAVLAARPAGRANMPALSPYLSTIDLASRAGLPRDYEAGNIATLAYAPQTSRRAQNSRPTSTNSSGGDREVSQAPRPVQQHGQLLFEHAV